MLCLSTLCLSIYAIKQLEKFQPSWKFPITCRWIWEQIDSIRKERKMRLERFAFDSLCFITKSTCNIYLSNFIPLRKKKQYLRNLFEASLWLADFQKEGIYWIRVPPASISLIAYLTIQYDLTCCTFPCENKDFGALLFVTSLCKVRIGIIVNLNSKNFLSLLFLVKSNKVSRIKDRWYKCIKYILV